MWLLSPWLDGCRQQHSVVDGLVPARSTLPIRVHRRPDRYNLSSAAAYTIQENLMQTLVSSLALISGLLLAQSPTPTDTVANPLSGRWIVGADFYGTRINLSLQLQQDGDRLTGEFDGDKLEGSVDGRAVHFLAKDDRGNTEKCDATIEGNSLSGTIVFAGVDDPTQAEL
jgi:hypothetical protein